MSQHDMDITNQTAPSARADINLALKALASTSSGSAAPSPSFANQLWYDTTNSWLRLRDQTNSYWIVLGYVNQSTGKFDPNFTPSSNTQATTGTDNTTVMTPLRVKDSINTNAVPVSYTVANNLIASTCVGVGQSWQDMSGSRTYDTVYQNFTGRPIQVSITADATGPSRFLQASTDAVTWVNVCGIPENGVDWVTVTAIIPHGHAYRVLGSCAFFGWGELR